MGDLVVRDYFAHFFMEHYKNLSLEDIVVEIDGETIREEWKPIPNFEGRYMASNFSRIKALPNKVHPNSEKILKQSRNKKDYLIVVLVKDNHVRYTARVHIVIAKLFKPNPLNLPVVNHDNGIKYDPSLSNLEWTTHKGNTQHALRTGLMDCNIGENSPLAKLTNNEIISISRSKLSNKELSEIYDVTPENISLIRTGKNCTFVTGIQYTRRKVTKEMVIEIFNSNLNVNQLSEKYGISKDTVNNIKSGRTSSDITGKVKKKFDPLSDESVMQIFKSKLPPKELSEIYHVNVGYVRQIKRGERKSNLTGMKYVKKRKK